MNMKNMRKYCGKCGKKMVLQTGLNSNEYGGGKYHHETGKRIYEENYICPKNLGILGSFLMNHDFEPIREYIIDEKGNKETILSYYTKREEKPLKETDKLVGEYCPICRNKGLIPIIKKEAGMAFTFCDCKWGKEKKDEMMAEHINYD